ncbi:MAG: ribonuclease III [Eubacteriales bacterium]|nr:ribonuclease III [Eubacteriales bacterium]
MKDLERALRYHFQDSALLSRALTHPSTKLPDNQRLEFLGDAILEFCVSDMLYRKYSQFQEGKLTARRAALVCEHTLSVLARQLELGRYLLMGNGEEQTGGREKASILADTMEAVLAAIYMDGGYEAVKTVINRLYEKEETLISQQVKDEKSALQEYTQAMDMGLPEYEIVGESGPDHDRHFTARVHIQGKAVADGSGNSKKNAEQAAARAALESLAAKQK